VTKYLVTCLQAIRYVLYRVGPEYICKGTLPLCVVLVINDNPYGLMFFLSFI